MRFYSSLTSIKEKIVEYLEIVENENNEEQEEWELSEEDYLELFGEDDSEFSEEEINKYFLESILYSLVRAGIDWEKLFLIDEEERNTILEEAGLLSDEYLKFFEEYEYESQEKDFVCHETHVAAGPIIKNITSPLYKEANGQLSFLKNKSNDKESNSILKLMHEANIHYIDNRLCGGALWITGGEELKPFIKKISTSRFKFNFKKGGGKATKGKDAWWTR